MLTKTTPLAQPLLIAPGRPIRFSMLDMPIESKITDVSVSNLEKDSSMQSQTRAFSATNTPLAKKLCLVEDLSTVSSSNDPFSFPDDRHHFSSTPLWTKSPAYEPMSDIELETPSQLHIDINNRFNSSFSSSGHSSSSNLPIFQAMAMDGNESDISCISQVSISHKRKLDADTDDGVVDDSSALAYSDLKAINKKLITSMWYALWRLTF